VRREPPGGWTAHEGLITPIVARYYKALGGQGRVAGALEWDDLFQQGRLGLIAAAERWDPERGAFSTTAVLWIRNAIGRYVQNHARLVRLPVYELNRRYRAGTLTREHNVRLDAPAGIDSDSEHRTVGESIPANDVGDPIEAIAAEQDRAAVHVALEKLPPNLAAVIRGRFFDERTLLDLGQDSGLSRERIRQLESEGLEKLRSMFKRSRREGRSGQPKRRRASPRRAA
jgi:RNA polymerase primary sigma factor